MSEMRKRMAKAMADRFLERFAKEPTAGRYDGDQGEVRIIVDGKWIDLVDLADAALAAMREPTQAMIMAWVRNHWDAVNPLATPDTIWPDDRGHAVGTWQMFMDAALSDNPERSECPT